MYLVKYSNSANQLPITLTFWSKHVDYLENIDVLHHGLILLSLFVFQADGNVLDLKFLYSD